MENSNVPEDAKDDWCIWSIPTWQGHMYFGWKTQWSLILSSVTRAQAEEALYIRICEDRNSAIEDFARLELRRDADGPPPEFFQFTYTKAERMHFHKCLGKIHELEKYAQTMLRTSGYNAEYIKDKSRYASEFMDNWECGFYAGEHLP